MITTPYIYSLFFPQLIWQYKSINKTLYLTFDDGPTPIITQQVLDILNKYSVKATFFCLGKNVEKNPEIYKTIIELNHSIGNHTFNHLNGWNTSNKKYFDDINKAAKLINSSLFRPPYGKITFSQIKHLRKIYKIIMWDIISKDYKPNYDLNKSLKHIFTYTKSGSILVFHDSVKAHKNMISLLPHVIEHFLAKGFTFSAIPMN